MDHLGAWKEDGLELASGAVGVLVGAGIAKVVVDKLVGAGGALKKAGEPAPGAAGMFPEDDLFPGATLVGALVPAAVGIALQVYGAGPVRRAAGDAAAKAVTGAAIGMVAVSVGKLVIGFGGANVEPYVALKGLGGDVYDYGMNGLGIGPGDVTAYMNGAPTTAMAINGAPIDAELAGAPVSISGGGMAAAFY